MLKKIDINNFGSFQNFSWRNNVRDKGDNIAEFKRLNIIYGRNYSGKTTLSCLFQFLQTGALPINYKNPEFKIMTDAKDFTPTDVAQTTYDVRVYNKHFVDQNLSFLRNEDNGEIRSFAIIGSENVKIEEDIKNKEKELGSLDARSGLRFDHARKNEEYREKERSATKAAAEFRDKLSKFANNDIKQDAVRYGDVLYNITKLLQDIEIIRKGKATELNSEQLQNAEQAFKEEALPDIRGRLDLRVGIAALHDQARALVSRKISPSAAIQAYLDDDALQAWAKDGMNLHRGHRESCGFCGHRLPDDLWDKLDAHFDKESANLEGELRAHLALIEREATTISAIELPNRAGFYVVHRDAFDRLNEQYRQAAEAYLGELASIKGHILAKLGNLFKPAPMRDLADCADALIECVSQLNNLIADNNKRTETLEGDRAQARTKLKFHAVAQFIRTANLAAEEANVQDLRAQAAALKGEADALERLVQECEHQIQSLRSKLKDESQGAVRVNELLSHHFGHDSLKLEAVDDGTQSFKFRVKRGNDYAYNLSEGECSLLSFCYFMAKLDDVDTKGRDVIVYIDDPISSLDANHIFFIFSLIEGVLAKPEKHADGSNLYRYKQLFISTHNLEFLKYLKRLSAPSRKHGDHECFIIERRSTSTIRLMPQYLKNYTTEYNYLFHQIVKCSRANSDADHDAIYNFGNNLRKFLEAFLFYKYPCDYGDKSHQERLHRFFGNDDNVTALTTRLTNEMSHLEEIFDRGMKPIEIPEIPKLAAYVLGKIQEKDPDQYQALMQSIGEEIRAGAPAAAA